MNAKLSVFVICVKAIMYLSLYNLLDCTFKYYINQLKGILTILTYFTQYKKKLFDDGYWEIFF